uniref:WH2 domain-containing protein n=1 Tax=Panagrolaimus sp. JU765 TaxID=591449 RepID=A0AC34Q469_9BILA
MLLGLTYFKTEKSSYSSLNNGQPGTLNQQNRRCSSTSNGPSSSNNVYAPSTLGQKNLQNGFHNEMHQVASAPQMNGGSQQQQQKSNIPPPPAPPMPTNGIPPISNKVPPPPPPPPDLKSMATPKGLSFAEQLKMKSGNLNKVNANDANGTNNPDVPPTPQPKSSIGGGGNHLMSELMSKIESRNNSKNCKADTVSTGSSSGVSSSSVGASSDTLDSVSTLTTKRINVTAGSLFLKDTVQE